MKIKSQANLYALQYDYMMDLEEDILPWKISQWMMNKPISNPILNKRQYKLFIKYYHLYELLQFRYLCQRPRSLMMHLKNWTI